MAVRDSTVPRGLVADRLPFVSSTATTLIQMTYVVRTTANLHVCPSCRCYEDLGVTQRTAPARVQTTSADGAYTTGTINRTIMPLPNTRLAARLSRSKSLLADRLSHGWRICALCGGSVTVTTTFNRSISSGGQQCPRYEEPRRSSALKQQSRQSVSQTVPAKAPPLSAQRPQASSGAEAPSEGLLYTLFARPHLGRSCARCIFADHLLSD